MPISARPEARLAYTVRHAANFPYKKTGISRKTERRPARTNGLYLKQLRCDSSLCRYEKTIRPARRVSKAPRASVHALRRPPFSR